MRILSRLLIPLGALLCLYPAPGRGDAAISADDFLLLPLRMHLLRAKQVPDLDCQLKENDARRILEKINGIWRQVGIQFWAESIREEQAAAQDLYLSLGENVTEAHLRNIRPRDSQSADVFHLYYIRKMSPNGICLGGSGELLFVKDTARLRAVDGGIDEPLPRVSAHEIGHALGLPHRQDTFNLMASGTTGTGLNDAEGTITRGRAQGFPWHLRPAAALALADQHAQAGRKAPAQALYRALSRLPGGDVARAARAKLAP